MMRRTTAPLVGFVLLSATALYAQNLVKNPGFEASDQNIAPWQVRKGDASKFVNPMVVKNAPVGLGDDNAFQFQASAPRGQTVKLAIEQQVVIPATGDYRVSVSSRIGATALFADGLNAPSFGGLLWIIGSSSPIAHLFASDSATGFGISQIDNIAVRPRVVRLQAGPALVVVEVLLDSHSDTILLDDIVIEPVTQSAPHVAITTLTVGGANTRDEWVDVRTSATSAGLPTLIYAALQRPRSPISLPGIHGLLELDPTRDGGLVLLASGIGTAELRLRRGSVSVLGRELHFQAVQVDVASNRVQLGSRMSARIR